MNGSNNESNGVGDEGNPSGGAPPGPPPAYQGQGQPEMSLEALAYIEEQRRQTEQRAIFVQIYSAALTGILSGIAAKGDKITADNAALMAWTHANAGLQLLNRGAPQQAQPVQQPPPQQAIVPVAPPRPPQQPQQNPYQQQGAPFGNPYAQPYGNPYGGPVRGGMGPPGRPMQPPPGSTRGPTGQIQTGLGNFNYEVHYGPRNG
jgi:hypothetical protein